MVIDEDVQHHGDTALAELSAKHRGALPDTWTAQIGNGGRHIWLRATGPFRGQLCDGVDLKCGATGYLVAPPTPKPVPPNRFRRGTGNADALVEFVARQKRGNINNGLYWAACRAAERGLIDGAQLLDDLHAAFVRYVAFPDQHTSSAVTLWTAATHVLPAFEFAPRLVINSTEKHCGKTRLLDIVAVTCHDPLATVNATVAAICRSLGGDHPPTLLIDEADTRFGSKKVAENNEDFRALLNAGFQHGKPALRCVRAIFWNG